MVLRFKQHFWVLCRPATSLPNERYERIEQANEMIWKRVKRNTERQRKKKKLHVLCRWNCCVVVRASRAYVQKARKSTSITHTQSTQTQVPYFTCITAIAMTMMGETEWTQTTSSGNAFHDQKSALLSSCLGS